MCAAILAPEKMEVVVFVRVLRIDDAVVSWSDGDRVEGSRQVD